MELTQKMDLFRIHAYSVVPQRTSGTVEPPPGGPAAVNAEIRKILTDNINDADFANRAGVIFEVDGTTRTNDVRDLVMSYAFDDDRAARTAALGLATRLAGAMDQRSQPCLFVPSAFRDDPATVVILWLFPKEAALRLTTHADTAAIELITEAFSQESRHKKAAYFHGRKMKTGFLEGKILDHQANSVSRDVADFWMKRFLSALPSLKAETGTRFLAKILREAYDAAETQEGRDGLHAAILGIRTAPRRAVSLQGFAESRLTGEAREQFLSRLPNDETASALFDFDRETFESILQFHLFELKKGVFVSAPFGEIGETVRIAQDGNRRVLSCRDEIVDEKLRTRRG